MVNTIRIVDEIYQRFSKIANISDQDSKLTNLV
jgi:predicted transcriptional regulator